ncbi:hypothetical protein [Streptomyces sp. NPDC020681]
MNTVAKLMPQQHRAKTIGRLAAGRRLAQEWVGYRYLIRDMAWHGDLV